MICSVRSMAVQGIRGSAVVAECYISNGLPGFDIVGLPDAAVKEAGQEMQGGSIYPLIVNSETARLTEERVLELYERLK